MDLAINGIRLMGRRLGVGRYIEYLLRYWTEISHPFDRIVVYTPGPIAEGVELPVGAEHQIVATRHSHAYWEQVVLAKLQSKHSLLFCPSYVVPLFGRGKTVLTHHGSYEAVPSAFPLRERLKTRFLYQLSTWRADRVITVSESSKRDIIRFYGIHPDKITVIHVGVDQIFRPIENKEILSSTRKRYFGFDRPYILFVGKLSKRRHIPELLLAFAQLKRAENIPHGLMLVGPDEIGQDVSRLARMQDLESSVVRLEFASHDELVKLYSAADLFIYPSSYEGFGLPVLEALACGVPTIAVRNPAVLEFADGIALLAADGTPKQLYRAMRDVIFSEEQKAIMRTSGPKRAQQFGWASIARETMNILSSVVKQ